MSSRKHNAAVKVKVICRFRPAVSKEERQRAREVVFTYPDDQTVHALRGDSVIQTFRFDTILRENCTQRQVFETTAKDSVEGVFQGYNCALLLYGQTGAGKYFSAFGSDWSNNEKSGIIPQSVHHMFEHIIADTSGTEYTIKCAFYEILNDTIRDLLHPTREKVVLRDTPRNGVFLQGLSEPYITTEEEAAELIQLGDRFRAKKHSARNDPSARSHIILEISVGQKLVDGTKRTGKLTFAILADIIDKDQLQEGSGKKFQSAMRAAKGINKSLATLSACVGALTRKQKHIPYRNSKLTHILKDCLGGNCKTTLFIAASAYWTNHEQTLAALRFGRTATAIENQVHVNKERSANELTEMVSVLQRQVSKLRRQNNAMSIDSMQKNKKHARKTSRGTPKRRGRLSSSSEGSGHTTPPLVKRDAQPAVLDVQAIMKAIKNLSEDDTDQLKSDLNTELQLQSIDDASPASSLPDFDQILIDKDEKVVELTEQIKELENKLLARDDEQTKVEQKQQDALNELQALKKLNVELKEQLQAANTLQEESVQKIDEMETQTLRKQLELENMQERLDQREKDMNALKAEKQISDKLGQQAILKKEQLAIRNEYLTSTNKDLSTSCADLNRTVEQLTDRLQNRHSEALVAGQERLNEKGKLSEEVQKNQLLQTKIQELEKTKESLEAQAMKLREDLKEYEIECSTSKKLLSSESEKVSEAAKQNETLKEALKNLEIDLRVQKSTSDHLLKETKLKHDHVLNDLKKELEETQQKSVARKDQLKKLEEENSTLTMSLQREQIKLELVQKQSEERLERILSLQHMADMAKKDDQPDGTVENTLTDDLSLHPSHSKVMATQIVRPTGNADNNALGFIGLLKQSLSQ